MQKTNCALTAMGMVTALGCDIKSSSDDLFSGQIPHFEKHKLLSENTTVPVGKIKCKLSNLPKSFSSYICHNHIIAYNAFLQIEASVNKLKSSISKDRIGVVIGSSTSGLDATEKAFVHWKKNNTHPANYTYEKQHSMGSAAQLLASLADITGPAYTISTACSSSAKALLSARGLLELDICDAVITGGVDTLCNLTVNGFFSLASLSPQRMNPLSQNRDGLNIGEGCALFVMTREKNSEIELMGGGETMDAHHMSAPHPEGIGAEEAMRAALRDAQLTPDQISYINLHGTATRANDAMESKACSKIFKTTKVSSTKPFVGHCLGAAGAIELAFCYLSLKSKNRLLPPHIFDNQIDPSISSLNLVSIGDKYPLVSTSTSGTYFMSNSFAFGGSNCSLIIGQRNWSQ